MSGSNDTLRNPLTNARGLGSANEGTHHWWMQRVTALAQLPLAIWFMYHLVTHLAEGGREAIGSWFASPFVALAALFLFVSITLHARLGLQVVIEDYLHQPCKKLTFLLLVKYAYIGAGIVACLSIVKLHFFGA